MKNLILLAAFVAVVSSIPLENNSSTSTASEGDGKLESVSNANTMNVMQKFFLLLLMAGAAEAMYAKSNSLLESDGWYVPTEDGQLEWVTKEQYENESNSIPDVRPESVKFYLYTKFNPTIPKQLFANNARVLSGSNFRNFFPTSVIIHGWRNDYESAVNTDVRIALLLTGYYNVIVVDWSEISGTLNYISSRNAVPGVGKLVAQFLDFISTSSGPLFDLTLVGHSLGAHVAGFAGKQVTKDKANIIIGLDPAYPLFSYSDCSSRLCNTDAYYVESIQTSGSYLGFLQPIGKAAFYPNGGKSQPGCGIDLTGSCAHSRAYMYYAEAIVMNSFKSIECSNYNDAVRNKCGDTFSNVLMGTGYGNSGVFYVPVNSKPPYGKGGE